MDLKSNKSRKSGAARPRVVFPFIGDTFGGSHRSALLLIEELNRHQIDIIVIVENQGLLTLELEKRSISYHTLKGRWLKPRFLFSRVDVGVRVFNSFIAVRRFLKKNTPDLVHINDGRTLIAWGFPCKGAGVPYVWHQRTIYVKSRLSRYLIHHASIVVCISRTVQNSLPERFAKACTIISNPVKLVAPDPVKVTALREQIIATCSTENNQYIIGYIGNLQRIKRPLIFAEAIALLNDQLDIPCIGLVAGEDRGGYQAKMRDLLDRFGLDKQLFFAGFRPNIEEWIATVNIIMAPSVYEGFGRTVLEGMSLGIPVIASDAFGHREIIINRKNGLLVDSDNPRSFATAAQEIILNSKLRDSLVMAGLASAKQYTAIRHSRQIIDIYRQLIPRVIFDRMGK